MAKITNIRSIRTRAAGTWVIIKVETDQPGLYGIGSASDHYHAKTIMTAVETIAPLLIGRDASHIEDNWQALYTSGYWRNGSIQNRIDEATKDLKNRADTLEEMVGGVANVDMADAISRLQLAQFSVQAAAEVFGTLRDSSLLNFLR